VREGIWKGKGEIIVQERIYGRTEQSAGSGYHNL
jgi:hypothetical protein